MTIPKQLILVNTASNLKMFYLSAYHLSGHLDRTQRRDGHHPDRIHPEFQTSFSFLVEQSCFTSF